MPDRNRSDDGRSPRAGAPADPSVVERAVAEAHRTEWARVLAVTARVAGDLDLAEECVQDAYVAALAVWTRDGIPRAPAAWLTTTARNRALDLHRRAQTLRAKLPLLIDGPAETHPEPDAIPDDRLRLIFTCCHPALSREAQVALTLRLVCGVSTADVAGAFLVPEATMAARVTRAKKKIAAARIPYRVPAPAELPDRLDAVLTVVHLLYASGHTARTGDDLLRPTLADRAIGLARLLAELMPDEREARGLLALLLLLDARRATRLDPAGDLVLIADQDRSRWDRDMIDEGRALAMGALRGGPAGRFALQAVIAALHAEAPTAAATDWPQIVGVYDALLKLWPSPVVALNRAVALAEVAGPAVALAEVDELSRDDRIAGYHYTAATRADLLRRLGRPAEAADAYRVALELAENGAERRFLARRLAEVQRGR